MGRALFRVLLFLGLTVSLYMGSFVILSRYNQNGTPAIHHIADYYTHRGGNSWTRFKEYRPSTSYDAIIIGSSHAYRGYDPAIFAARGYNVFNLGSSAQTPLNSYFLAEHYLNRRNAPLLIYDVYAGTFTDPGLESTSDLVQNIPSGLVAAEMVWALRDMRGLNLLSLRFAQPKASSYYTDPNYVALGFAPQPDSLRNHMQPKLDETILWQVQQKRFFEACVRLCQERGIQLAISSHYSRKGTNIKRHDKFASYIDSVLAGTGIHYVDLTFANGINDLDHFADDNHLNSSGARIFTGHLVDSLETLGLLFQKQLNSPLRIEPTGD